MITYRRLCESDYRFLSLIWEHEPVNSTELVRICASELGWKKSTVYTMLKKLSSKSLVVNEKAVVRSIVPKKSIQCQESRLFVDQLFAGSLSSFLFAYYKEGIDEIEAKELEELLGRITKNDFPRKV